MQHVSLAPAAILAVLSLAATSAAASHDAPNPGPDPWKVQSPAPGSSLPYNGESNKGASDARRTSDADVIFVFHQMEELLQMGKPIDASLSDLRKVVDSLPGGPVERDEMYRAIEELSDRSKATFVEPVDVGVIRQQFFWARFDAAAKRVAAAADDSQQGVARVSAALLPLTGGICTAYVPFQARRINGKIREAFVHQEQFAQTPDQLVTGVRLTLIQSRMQQARQLLNYRVRSSTVVRGDHWAIYRLLALRAQLLEESQYLDPAD